MAMSKPSKTVKQLYDSAYIKPIDNPRVLQDSHPVRSAAFADALARYERSVKKEQRLRDEHMGQHRGRIADDADAYQQERERKVEKQRAFKE